MYRFFRLSALSLRHAELADALAEHVVALAEEQSEVIFVFHQDLGAGLFLDVMAEFSPSFIDLSFKVFVGLPLSLAVVGGGFAVGALIARFLSCDFAARCFSCLYFPLSPYSHEILRTCRFSSLYNKCYILVKK